MFALHTTLKKAESMPVDITSASVPDTLASLHVNPDTGLLHEEVDVCRKEHGFNEVAEKKGHPVLKLLGKLWGVSALFSSGSVVRRGEGNGVVLFTGDGSAMVACLGVNDAVKVGMIRWHLGG